MKIIKYVVLVLLLWGIPSFFAYEESIGSKFSSLTFGLLLVYYFLSVKRRIIIPFLILGILYFSISGLVYLAGDPQFFRNDLIKYVILVLCSSELARETTKKELFTILMLGTTSVIFHAVFFQGDFGRYSGFYLDPNGAGFVCAIAYCLSFNIQPNLLKVVGQFVITFAGLLTFSRTFIILWLLISIISIISDRKNSLNFGLGVGALIVIFTVGTFLKVDTVRFQALENLFSDNNTASVKVIQNDSRTETWSRYYEVILDNPFFGNGYRQLSGISKQQQGVHNTYLMVLGEAGIFPFLTFIGIYFYMLMKSVSSYKTEAYKPMLASTLVILFLTTHNYFDNFFLIFVSLWLFVHITENHSQEDKELNEEESQLLNTTV